jgi:hypothetical protein
MIYFYDHDVSFFSSFMDISVKANSKETGRIIDNSEWPAKLLVLDGLLISQVDKYYGIGT